MKILFLSGSLAAVALVACENMSTPIKSSSFDPLTPPGSMQSSVSTFGPAFSPGQFVSAAINNTAFYKNKPKENQDADKLIEGGTQMKIVEISGDHLKVELDSGEVGWVPSVMVVSGESAAGELVPVDGIYQVYPPLPDGGALEPLPFIDASGLPPEDALPTIIDPDQPLDTTTPSLDSVPDIQAVEPTEAPKETEEKVEPSEEVEEAD